MPPQPDDERAFTIVRFTKSNEVEAVPSSWVCDKVCLWPLDYGAARLKKAITHEEQPDSSFRKHDVRVIGTASTYQRAREKARCAEDTDDVATTDGEKGRGKRRRKANTYFDDHETSFEESHSSERSLSSPSAELESTPEDTVLQGTPPRFPDDVTPATPVPQSYVASTSFNKSLPFQSVPLPRVQQAPGYHCSIAPTQAEPLLCRIGAPRSVGPDAGYYGSGERTGNMPNTSHGLYSGAPMYDMTTLEPERLSMQSTLATSVQAGYTSQPVQVLQPLLPARRLSTVLPAVPETSTQGPAVCSSHLGCQQGHTERKLIMKELAYVRQQNEQILHLMNQWCERPQLKMDEWSFPLRCAEELGRLEDSLQENKDLERSLIKRLAGLGGISVGHAVRAQLRFLLVDEFAAEFSYSGQKNKQSFSSLRLCRLVREAVRANVQTQGATDAEMKTIIMVWLKNAKARTSSRQLEQVEVQPRPHS